MFTEKCNKYCANHLDQGVFARKVHKNYVFTCGATWLGWTTGTGNLLACFKPDLLDDWFSVSREEFLAKSLH